MRRWIRQDPKTKCCGQIAVAVVAGITLDEAIKLVGKKGTTKTKDLVKALRKIGFSCPDRCRKMPMPPLAIAQMRSPYRKSGWHWVVVDGKKIYDGCSGTPDGTVKWHGGKMTSYLPITKGHKMSYTLYNEKVMDHFMNPRNMGELPDANGIGEVGAAACGDIMKVSIRVKDGKIEDARFKTFGCGSAIAASSMATELIKGRTIEELEKFSNQEVVDALGGLPPVKIHCSVLAEEALKAALEDYKKKNGII
jgi:nitrogen fixation NifU-like protein